MADKRDYYEVLGVDKNADDATLKKAYRNMAKKYHPDTHPDDKEAEAKFKEAGEAYAILSDPEKRKAYDQFGHAAFEQGGAGAGGAGGFGGFGGFSGFDGGDIFGDIFGDLFGGGRGGRASANAVRQGQHVRTQVKITFEESIFGTEKDISLNMKEACEKCHGTGAREGTGPVTCGQCGGSGQVIRETQSIFGMMRNVGTCPSCQGKGKIIKDKCSSCRGTGYTSVRKLVQVKIPAGINNGQSIRVPGYGEPGENGGPRGDLLVEVYVAPSPIFSRDDMDLYSSCDISMVQAALGDTIRIRTVDGDVEYEMKAGTQPGTRIRLRGKGVPSLRDKNYRGDQYVTFTVKVPERMNERQKKALREYDAAMGGSLNRK